jgi:hypothetical protein
MFFNNNNLKKKPPEQNLIVLLGVKYFKILRLIFGLQEI